MGTKNTMINLAPSEPQDLWIEQTGPDQEVDAWTAISLKASGTLVEGGLCRGAAVEYGHLAARDGVLEAWSSAAGGEQEDEAETEAGGRGHHVGLARCLWLTAGS